MPQLQGTGDVCAVNHRLGLGAGGAVATRWMPASAEGRIDAKSVEAKSAASPALELITPRS
ncbi:hypothetical protein RCCGEPOP_13827 [Rhizobium sp. Pop5]|nr:hypothetical protein RCCGEPOP_13827 [Rhizobium sp. Pop5]